MPISINVINGTRPSDGNSLCQSCANAVITKGDRESEVHIECQRLEKLPAFRKIVDCTAYTNRSATTLSEMRDIAWVLVTDRNRQKIGFQQAREWRKENENERMIPDEGY